MTDLPLRDYSEAMGGDDFLSSTTRLAAPSDSSSQLAWVSPTAWHGTHTAILHVLNSLEGANREDPLFITFWDIRRAFDSIPKWLQRLAWARLGISEIECFLSLNAVGTVTIRTPYQ
jgi:hypothetical protein